MAEAFFEDQDSFSCSICLDILKDPVTTSCGHNYCMCCIEGCWDQDDLKGVYSCPECRQTFAQRPVLNRNTLLAKVVEKLKHTALHAAAPAAAPAAPPAAPPALCYAGPGDVECDFCTGRKHKALMSCLVCLVSYCETHLQPHYNFPALKKHMLVKASTQLQEKICSQHDKLLEVYCRTDQQCICLLCVMDEHKGHDTVSAAAERTEKQKQVGEKQQKSQQRIQEREKEMQELRRAVDSLKLSAQAAVDDSERIFAELIRTMETRCSEVKELIRDQEKAEVSQAEGLLEQLEQEVAELRRRDAELVQFSHTEDNIHFLQRFKDHSAPPVSEEMPAINLNQSHDFKTVMTSDLQEKLMLCCKKGVVKISAAVKAVHILQSAEPSTQAAASVAQYHGEYYRKYSYKDICSLSPGRGREPGAGGWLSDRPVWSHAPVAHGRGPEPHPHHQPPGGATSGNQRSPAPVSRRLQHPGLPLHETQGKFPP
ncbi:E3 ubiquitin-protein ligase TRIM47-like isoform X1 [Oncorhynchus masou masou]|uniref:E3 ubiquitin-protein ligase TRIM47-like isoform X1 n=1 Tax=Oncorhynchus masou masou TaxID=90313 RepID=UPI00318457A1